VHRYPQWNCDIIRSVVLQALYLWGGLISISTCIWIGIGVGSINQTGELYFLAILMGKKKPTLTLENLFESTIALPFLNYKENVDVSPA